MRYEVDGVILDTDKAKESWPEATRWNGNNHVSVATGSQFEHETLFLSAKGRFWVEHTSDWQGRDPSARVVDAIEATRWLLLNKHELPPQLAQYEGVRMRYILNSAVVTAPGTYTYRHITPKEAKLWVQSPGWISTIGYEETAAALSLVTGVTIPTDRRVIRMYPGDSALVFRLTFPPGNRRIDPREKGTVGQDYILDHCEIGLLVRES